MGFYILRYSYIVYEVAAVALLWFAWRVYRRKTVGRQGPWFDGIMRIWAPVGFFRGPALLHPFRDLQKRL